MDHPNGIPPAKRARLEDGGGSDLASDLAAQPAASAPVGDPQDWRMAMTATLASLLSQAEAGRAAMEAQVAALQAQVSALQATSAAQAAALDAKVTAMDAKVTALDAKATTRFSAIEATLAEDRAAMGAPHANRIALAKRPWLSHAEEVLAIPYLSQRSVMSYLRQDEALALRAASRTCREAVAEHGWSDFDEDKPYDKSLIRGRLSSWRKCFPLARAANLCRNKMLADADFVHLRGVRRVRISGCSQTAITDAAFAHLAGIRELRMANCNQATITDAAFAHLRGIHTLNMSGCNQATITDAAFAHLRGIHSLSLWGCTQISNAALVHLMGIRELLIVGCPQLTNAALAPLRARGAIIHRVKA